MNVDLCIKYLLRDNPKYPIWNNDPIDKPWAINNSLIVMWNEQIIGLPQPTAEELAAIEPIATAWEEEQFQASKSANLKMLENIYVDFLTNDWTPLLRAKGIIAPDYTITVENTDEIHNIGYLISLRAIDKESYYKMAGEFERLKNNIIAQGGIMSKVRQHN